MISDPACELCNFFALKGTCPTPSLSKNGSEIILYPQVNQEIQCYTYHIIFITFHFVYCCINFFTALESGSVQSSDRERSDNSNFD